MTSVNVSSKPPFFRPFAEAAPGQQDRASVEGHVAGSCPSALDMAQPEVAEKKGNPSWEREPENRNYLHPTEGFPHEGLRARPGQEQKPAMSYIALIANAILTSPNKKLNLGSIYKYIEDTFPYYKGRGQGWRNSVRHNLSLNECFIKAGRCEDGKGNYWSIHPSNLDDFSKGDFRQRRRCRRRGRAKELPVIYPSCPFPVEPLALNSLYSPYTEQERRAYRLDEVLYRQYISNPFWRWYHSCRNPAGSGCDTGLNTGAQWQGLGENGPPPNFFKTLNN